MDVSRAWWQYPRPSTRAIAVLAKQAVGPSGTMVGVDIVVSVFPYQGRNPKNLGEKSHI